MQPEFEDEQAINPFDFGGAIANFKIKIKRLMGIGTMTHLSL